MKKLLILVALAFVGGIFLPSCEDVGTAPVNANIKLNWTSPGDDGIVGTAASYDLRWALDSMLLKNNWATCAQITGEPTPKLAGTPDSILFVLPVELGSRYYFAMKSQDEVPNVSQLSNIVLRFFPDSIPPSPVTDLR